MSQLLDYVERDGAVQRLNPISKLFFAVAVCVACFATPSIPVLVGLLLVDMLYGIAAGIVPQTLRALRALLLMSIVLFVLQPLFIHTGDVLVPLGAMSITTDGLLLATRVCLKVIIACLAFSQLLYVTRVNDLTNALVKRCGLPYRYAFTVSTAIRFVPLFAGEMSGIMEAQKARGVEFDTRNPIRKMGLVLPLCVPLLVGCVRRIDSTAIAAELRGFSLRGRKDGFKDYPFSAQDVLAFFCGVLCIVLAFVL